MTFCGYHPKMETGIRTFGQGLVAAVCNRSERTGIPLSQVATLEQGEMNTLCEELSKLSGGPKKMALEGLSILIRGVFAGAIERMTRDTVTFDTAIAEEIDVVCASILPMEQRSQELSASGTTDPMRQLADWIANSR